MNWNQEMIVVDGRMYAGDKWLGEFSSHDAALAALRMMRNAPADMRCDGLLTPDDHDLIAAIDADC